MDERNGILQIGPQPICFIKLRVRCYGRSCFSDRVLDVAGLRIIVVYENLQSVSVERNTKKGVLQFLGKVLRAGLVLGSNHPRYVLLGEDAGLYHIVDNGLCGIRRAHRRGYVVEFANGLYDVRKEPCFVWFGEDAAIALSDLGLALRLAVGRVECVEGGNVVINLLVLIEHEIHPRVLELGNLLGCETVLLGILVESFQVLSVSAVLGCYLGHYGAPVAGYHNPVTGHNRHIGECLLIEMLRIELRRLAGLRVGIVATVGGKPLNHRESLARLEVVIRIVRSRHRIGLGEDIVATHLAVSDAATGRTALYLRCCIPFLGYKVEIGIRGFLCGTSFLVLLT